MSSGCVLISTTTLASAASSITVSGIPQTYHALRIVSLLETTGTSQDDGEVLCTFAGVGNGQYQEVTAGQYAATNGPASKTVYTGVFGYLAQNNTNKTTQFGAGFQYSGRNINNVASMEIYSSNYADTNTPLVMHIKSSKGCVFSNTPRQVIVHGAHSTLGNHALTAITFTTGQSVDFTTACSIRVYGYIN
jgi:hypothetical protein